MIKTRFTIISCVILSIALCAMIEIRNGIETRKRTEILRQEQEEAERLTRENERLHQLIAQVQSSKSLSREQLLELLNLRNEVGTLRQSEPLKEKLKETNKVLRAAITKKEIELEEAQSLPNYWPKERLVYSGFADPESAIKSILAAMITGNMSQWKASCTTEALASLEKEWKNSGMSDAEAEAQFKKMGTMMVAESSGFHILNQKNSAPEEVEISLSFDGVGKTRIFVLRKVSSEWKVHNLIMSGQN